MGWIIIIAIGVVLGLIIFKNGKVIIGVVVIAVLIIMAQQEWNRLDQLDDQKAASTTIERNTN